MKREEKSQKKRQISPNEAFHQQQLTGVDMKRDTRTKAYPTDADATKKRNIIQSHYQWPDVKFKSTSR